MSAYGKDNGRWDRRGRQARRAEMATGQRKPPERAVMTNCDRRNAEQRRADLDAEAARRGVSSRCFI